MDEDSKSMLIDPESRVLAKEAAVSRAFDQLEQIEAIVSDCCNRLGNPDQRLEQWSEIYDILKKDRDNLEVLVGVAGETGFGKTSLLNALVGGRDELLPSSQSEACTAAVCIFSYNDDSDQAKKYRAKVYFKAKEKVVSELDSFLGEHADVEYESRIHGEDDELRGIRSQLLKQLRVIEDWSRLSGDDILKLSGTKIVEKSQEAKALFNKGDATVGIVRELSASKAVEFLNMIKPFIDSSTNVRRASKSGGKKPTMLYWPLVEKVQLFVKSDLLKQGLALVDLPGEMDALESRSAVARSYYSRLDKTMIVTHAIRGADNRTASDLIVSNHQALNLGLDGKFNGDDLCVVVTKIDDLDVDSFIKNWNGELPESLQADREQLEELEGRIDELDHEIGDLAEQLPDEGDKEREPDEPEDEGMKEMRKQLGEVKTKRRKTETKIGLIKGRLKTACVQERNSDLIEKIGEDLRQARRQHWMQQSNEDTHMSATRIFPVSSKAFRACVKRRPLEGFPDTGSTGIDGLARWLAKTSLPKREAFANSLLNRCHVLVDAIDGVVQTQAPTLLKLTRDEQEKTKLLVDEYLDALGEDLQKAHKNMKQSVTSHNPFPTTVVGDKKNKDGRGARNRLAGAPSVGECVAKASRDFVSKVRDWACVNPREGVKMHWSAYAACVRRHGGVFFSKGAVKMKFHWMGILELMFWRAFASRWTHSFHECLPRNMAVMNGKYRHAAEQLTKQLRHNPHGDLPRAFLEGFSRKAYKVENEFKVYQDQIAAEVERFRAEARDMRITVEESLSDCLGCAFEEANNIKGKGKFVKQMAIMDKWAAKVQPSIFETARSDAKRDLMKKRGEFFSRLRDCNDRFQKKVKAITRHTIKSVSATSAGSRHGEDALVGMDDESRNAVLRIAADWRRFWAELETQLPPDILPEEKDEAVEGRDKKMKKRRRPREKKAKSAGGGGGKDTSEVKKEPLVKDEFEDDELAGKKRRKIKKEQDSEADRSMGGSPIRKSVEADEGGSVSS